MNSKLKITSLLLLIILFFYFKTNITEQNSQSDFKEESKEYPNDWFVAQRTFPQKEIRYDIYKKALEKVTSLKKKNDITAGLWQFAGPTNIGGRISDVEMSPNSFDTIYAGAASGGVLKSVDGGNNWFSIFDNTLSLSIGDIAVDPVNTSTIYVGTGEVNAGGGSMTYDGMGVFKSTDGGINWRHLGLDSTRYISRIIVDPKNNNRIFLGAMGKLFAENNERGIYRSLDGGETWENVLFISGKTGCIDLQINPVDPNIIYAAMWERIREPVSRNYGGVECGIYKSTNGGNKWTQLTNGIPNNNTNVGRIGISISQSNPEILYAIYADESGDFLGVYKTTDGGENWQRTNDSRLSSDRVFSTFGWWFGNIRVSPANPDIAFVLGLDVYKTSNGGNSWQFVSDGVHVDQHGMYIHPLNENFIILGNDGGIFKTENISEGWLKALGLPITQFYTCEVDYQNPERLYGGTQDNFTIRTTTGSLDDWTSLTGGDGFHVLVDPKNNNYIYAESQYGNLFRSVNGGSGFIYSVSGISSDELKNWNTPVVFNPRNSASLYYGSRRLYKSINRAVSWTSISPPLANSYTGNVTFGTITTIAVAPSDTNYIYVGTDDGNVWVTKNGGTNWAQISTSLPLRWITRVAVDPFNKDVAYVTLSGYRLDDYLPHIFKTTNAGSTWADVSGNLPEVPLNDVIVDSNNTSVIYVASDVGVFYTTDNVSWNLLGTDLPNVPVTDITLHNPTRTLVAATFGRSMWKYDLNQITGIKENHELKNEFVLSQNYPNPFNPTTKIKFAITDVDAQHAVHLKVYDILGNEIETLINETKPGGTYEVEFNGSKLASGVYIYKLTAGKYSASRKMLLLK